MQLSLEIPLPHLSEFLPLIDFPFGLAHLALEDPEYCRKMQGCLLDNSMYELGESLSIDQLIAATESGIAPIAVIAPDWEGDKQGTLLGVQELSCVYAGRMTGWTIGALVQGKNLDERIECFCRLQEMRCSPIGFPFRSPREETIKHLVTEGMFDSHEWYHLFGLRDVKELSWKLPGRWSVDTGKPFKGFRMDKGPIRGHGKLDLHEELTPHERFVAAWNIAWMRKKMNE